MPARRLVAALLATAVLTMPIQPAIAQEDLVTTFEAGTENGVQFGPGDGGYKVNFDAFNTGPIRTHFRRTSTAAAVAPRATVSVAAQMPAENDFGDIALLFGVTDRGYYYLALSEDPDRVRWSIGRYIQAENRFDQFAGTESDVLHELETGNEMSVTIAHRDGDTPLLTVRINGAQVAEVPARDPEDAPTSPFGSVGILCTQYPGQDPAAYFFRDLRVTS